MAERASERLDLQRPRPVRGLILPTQAATQGCVYHVLEGLVAARRQPLEARCDVIVEGKGRSHSDILMPELPDVKMTGFCDWPLFQKRTTSPRHPGSRLLIRGTMPDAREALARVYG